jgi:uncharacterized protein (DUF983 family)
MSKYRKGKFGNGVEISAEIVNGRCPFCKSDGMFVSLYKTVFRCITCGSDLEQKINGKISYMPIGSTENQMVIKETKNLTDG